jgi:hypothetical protein
MEYLWSDESGVTVGELIGWLQGFPADTPVCFGPHGHFRFYRVKDRTGCVQIEFNESDCDYTLSPSHPYQVWLEEHPL